ncbi:hypothetical protein FQN49_001617 [Arthroderma sp. PD_2]|nr:hypothetical protein FQN49_001617 [Arthroderma sp. PD_2]
MARSLAAALDNAFMLDSEVDSLTNSIQHKQQLVSKQSRELEELEARIRETENRLKMQKGETPLASSGSGERTNNNTNTQNNARNNTQRRTPPDVSTSDKERGLPPLSTPNQSDDGFTTNASTSPATTDQDEETANHAGIHGRRNAEHSSKGKQGWS